MTAERSARSVTEVLVAGPVPLWIHPEWDVRFPWLVQGTTGRGEGDQPFDLGLSGSQPVGAALERWRALSRACGMTTALHARQVHRADLFVHRAVPPPGVVVMDGVDGHLTALPDLLIAVSVADCVPVSIVEERTRAIALVHSGWRGTAAGIVEGAVRRLTDEFGADPGELWLHCGPAICGSCYEVGAEVHTAIYPDRAGPTGRAPIDLRAAIAQRAVALGVPEDQVTTSSHCTRCGGDRFFSHRGGSAARQMGVMGIR